MKQSDIIRLPVKPLWDLLTPENRADFARQLGVPGNSVARWFKNGGIPLDRCDEFAIKHGYHPMSVWGEEWYDAEVLWLARLEQRRLRRNERNAGYRARARRRDNGGTAVGRPSRIPSGQVEGCSG